MKCKQNKQMKSQTVLQAPEKQTPMPYSQSEGQDLAEQTP